MRSMACLALAATLFTTACDQTGEREPGLLVPVTATGENGAALKSAGVTPKHDDHDDHSEQVIAHNGRRLALIKGYVNLMPVELVPCGLALHRLLPLGSAFAHAGEDHGPDPSLVDISEADGTRWPLGTLDPVPGRYCGLRLALVPVSAANAPARSDMAGRALFVQACYYDAWDASLPADDPQNRQHYCFNLRTATEAQEQLLALPAPERLDGGRRSLPLRVVLRYDRWFEGIDLEGYPHAGTAEEKAAFRAALEQDPERQRRLRENVRQSLSVIPD